MTRPPDRPRYRSLSLTKTFLPLTAPRILGASATRIIAQSEDLWCCKPEHGPKIYSTSEDLVRQQIYSTPDLRQQIRKGNKRKIALQKIWCYKIAMVDQLMQPALPLYNQSFHCWIRTIIGQSIPANWKKIGDCKQQLIKQNIKQKMNSKRIPHQYQFRGWNSLQTGTKQEVRFWPILRVPSSPQKWEILKQFADAKGYPKDTCNVRIKTQYHRS